MRSLYKARLKSDNVLLELLGSKVNDDKIYPNYSSREEPYLVLKIRPTERGRVNVDDVEIKVIDSDVERQELIQEKVLALFEFGETLQHFRQGNNVIITSHLTGSGELEYEDLGLYEKVLNFEVKWR